MAIVQVKNVNHRTGKYSTAIEWKLKFENFRNMSVYEKQFYQHINQSDSKQ